MKKILLLSTLLLQLTIVFGQTKTENKQETDGMAGGDRTPTRQEVPPDNKINYESRAYQNDCYKSFAFTVKNYGYNKDGKFYSWGVAVKNNYSQAVQLKYKLIVGNDNKQYGTLTYYIKPGETYTNDMGKVKAIIVNSSSDDFQIEVSEVCFEGQDCYKNGYVGCNLRQTGVGSASTKSETTPNPTPASWQDQMRERGQAKNSNKQTDANSYHNNTNSAQETRDLMSERLNAARQNAAAAESSLENSQREAQRSVEAATNASQERQKAAAAERVQRAAQLEQSTNQLTNSLRDLTQPTPAKNNTKPNGNGKVDDDELHPFGAGSIR